MKFLELIFFGIVLCYLASKGLLTGNELIGFFVFLVIGFAFDIAYERYRFNELREMIKKSVRTHK